MPLDDELPLPPTGDGEAPEVQFSTMMDASLLSDVPGLNDPIPAGVKHFRLDTYKKTIDKEKQPRFDIIWKCQEEPNVGRILRDYVGWVSAEMIAAAQDPSNPQCQEGRALIRKRLPRVKEIQSAAGFKPSGQYDVEADFFAQHPEVKIPVTVSERKNKDEREFIDGAPNADFGKYTISTGTMQNGIPNTYLSVNRPS